jgi:alpha-beta hydrolase superfamily lysophospholipase
MAWPSMPGATRAWASLNLAGYSLYATDQRGHGRTAEHGTSAC